MVVFLISEDEERWGQDLHRTTDAFVCVVTKDRKQKWWDEKTPAEFKCLLVGACSNRLTFVTEGVKSD